MEKVGYDNDKFKNSSRLILVAVPDINNPFYSEVIKGDFFFCEPAWVSGDNAAYGFTYDFPFILPKYY